ncbi:hypothetical protein [Paraconexibacter sp. AEG42_29]
MIRLPLLGAAGAAALLVVPASAAAAVTGTLDQKCYSHIPAGGSEPIVAALSGGTPNAPFQLGAGAPGKAFGSSGSVTGTFDATGSATATLRDVAFPGGSSKPSKGRKVNLSVVDNGAGGAVSSVGSALVTNLAIDVDAGPKKARSSRLVSISGTPFANQALSAFIVKGSSTRVLKRIPLGRSNACGFADTKAVVAPPTRTPGSYRLYINAGKTLKKSLALGYAFKITRTGL